MPEIRTVKLGDVTDLTWGDTNTTKASYVPDGFVAYSAKGADGFLPYADYDRTGIVISAIGSDCGKTWLARGKWSCIKNTMRFFATDPDVDTEYLYWATKRPDFWPKRGSGQPFISQGDARNCEVTLPPLAEQQAIAGLLGSLDDKIELNRRMNETLEAQAQALFRDWFVDFGPVEAKMAGDAPYLAPDIWSLFPDRLDDGGVPQGWRRLHIGDLADLRGGKQLDKSAISASGPVAVFGGAGLMGYTTDHNADGYVITVGRVGAYCGQFFAHRGPAWVNNNASLIQPKQGISPEWLFLALRDLDVDVIKKGAAQPFISNGDLAALPVVSPTAEVMDAFLHLVLPLILMSESNAAEASILTHTRDLLLPKLMSGEIRVDEAERQLGRTQ